MCPVMDTDGAPALERTASQSSQASARSHKSGTVRIKAQRHASTAPSTPIPIDNALTSFPSLSPDGSPQTIRAKTPKRNVPADPGIQTPRKPPKHNPSIVERLTTTTPSFRGTRAALFDDSTARVQDIPGALHHASDDHIERLIARTGAVNLVRQLAADVAQRDAQVTTLRQRAEERERELKRMLREVEVSNLDIETRLHNLDNRAKKGGDMGADGAGAGRANKKGNGVKGIETAAHSINEMVNAAMAETLEGDMDPDNTHLDRGREQDPQATLRPSGSFAPHNHERGSIHSGLDGNRSRDRPSRSSSVMSGTTGFDDYAGQPRISSSGMARRTGLTKHAFEPPDHGHTLPRTRTSSSHNVDGSETRSRKSSFSVASWTLKLFAGNPAAGRDGDKQKTSRGRASTLSGEARKDSRAASMASADTGSSARAALMKVHDRSGDRKPAALHNIGANGTVKAGAQEAWRNITSSIIPPGSPMGDTSGDTTTNLGPVEMDTILPPDSRPPTLSQSYNDHHPSEFLTDRFGFIYDHRRNQRQVVATENIGHHRNTSNVGPVMSSRDDTESLATSNINGTAKILVGSPVSDELRPDTPASAEEVDEKSGMKWQDYLKVANYPTELLSHTPSTAVIPTLAAVKASPPKDLESPTGHRRSLPLSSATPQPPASTVVAATAEFAVSAEATPTSPTSIVKVEQEPVRLLLEQLTELHDSLQREKTVRWNEFLRKVRADRKREGDAAPPDGRSKQGSMPEVLLTDGEVIGVAGLGNKGKVGRAKWNEFKSLVLGGIPVAYRAKIWAECSGASALRAPGYYDELVTNGVDDPVIAAQIQMDINRTLTDNVFFRCGPGVAKLNEVLLAYARRNPEVGYCQGMNLIAASLLLIMPTAEDAFWMLATMVENILPEHYYDASLLASRADQHVLRQYVAEILPKLSAHLDALGVELEVLSFQWFLSVFTDCLSAEALFRVWDVVLCTPAAATFLFHLALALLKLNEPALRACDAPAPLYSYINHGLTNHAISIDGLIHASDALKNVVRRADVEERRARAVEREREVMRQRDEARREMRGSRDTAAESGGGGKGAAGVVPESRPKGEGEGLNGQGGDGQAEAEDEHHSVGELAVQSPMPVADDEGDEEDEESQTAGV